MFIDNELVFGSAWSPTTTGDNVSPNVLDTGPLGGTPNANGGRNLGVGSPIWFDVLVTAAVTSAGAATVDFRFRTAAAAALTSSPVDLLASGAIGKATLIANYVAFRSVVPSSSQYARYVGANANIGTAALTAGTFYVKLLKDIQGYTNYAGGFSIDV